MAVAPALRALNYPFLAMTVLALGRGWYLHVTHGGATFWRRRAGRVLVLATIRSIALWALRFAGVLGMRPS